MKLGNSPFGAQSLLLHHSECVFSSEEFKISGHMDSLLPNKRKIRKRIIYHDKGISSCSSRGKKQQTDPRGEDKKEKHHINRLRMNKVNVFFFNVYISGLKHKRFSKRIHSLG